MSLEARSSQPCQSRDAGQALTGAARQVHHGLQAWPSATSCPACNAASTAIACHHRPLQASPGKLGGHSCSTTMPLPHPCPRSWHHGPVRCPGAARLLTIIHHHQSLGARDIRVHLTEEPRGIGASCGLQQRSQGHINRGHEQVLPCDIG